MERKKILWVRLDAIGDNVLAASMLPHIYEKYDRPHITVVCQKHIAELYEASPQVERVIGVDKMGLFLDSKYRDSILQDLRKSEFDVALDSTCSWEKLSDLFVVGSLAKEKVAFENSAAIPDKVALKRGGAFTSLVRFKDIYEPEIERYRDFLDGIGIHVPRLNATLWTSEDDEKFADDLFAQNDLDPAKTIALFAFGRSHLRTYPFYGIALRDVCLENGFSVVALGDAAAYGFNQSCLNDIGVRSLNLSGKTALRQTAALLRKCRLAVGAETGVAHMACAVDVPNVIVIGGGHFGRFMPYSPKTSLVALPLECYWCDWECRYEYSHCVADIAPEVLEYALRETLRTTSEKPRVFLHPEAHWNSHLRTNGPAWEMPEKFTPRETVEIIPVEFSKKYNLGVISKRDLESKFTNSNANELPQPVKTALKAATDLRAQGESEKALEIVSKAIDENPASPDLLNFKGELEIGMGLLDEARATLFGIITYIPFHVDAMNNIAVVDILQKRYDSALGVLKRLLEVEPDNEIALSNLRFIESDLNVRSKLIDAEQSIMDGDFDTARKLLAEILNAYPAHEDALTDLAVVEAREGNSDEALRDLQKVLAANPGNEYAMQLMEKLLLKS